MEDKKSTRKSGWVEEYSKRDAIVQDILQRIRDHEDDVAADRSKAKSSAEAINKSGIAIRKMVMDSLSDSSSDDEVTRYNYGESDDEDDVAQPDEPLEQPDGSSDEHTSIPPPSKKRSSPSSASPQEKKRGKKLKISKTEKRNNALQAIVDSAIKVDAAPQASGIAEVLAFMTKQSELAEEREKRIQDFMLQAMATMAELSKK